ncbi:hypothetical protein [Enterobacteria phage vB_EcoM_IME540]|uniref:Homing endonuclease n=3 Tax=Dhakavirus TaxID=1914165 RepID=A0A0K1LKL0_9CAUD|nr:HNH endonuclease [Escherichia phage Bp7]YP_009202902.1 HNH endonuclease [Escherichia phage QL01]YP_010100498.1 HNH endonuclease [Escherichia phage vB_EcoM_005]QJA42704.1 hypothetical protein [Enterobacteria phage vB_EcoM_IME540]AEN93954.1 hypothetical protein EpBp7_0237 [Escherichia phage Bp7]AKU42828.1 hypothetical protein QL01_171 [Escherichia phage QL01]AZV00945.1 hypothetical protein vBEcoM005_058 [Escherichia phage vB_EcoM_005]
MYCTYLTIYTGSKLPRRYIGSTYVERILKEGYNGSVLSQAYKKIWNLERKENPHLFKTRILSLFETDKEARIAEKELQIKYNVVKSKNYINMSLAQPDGFFGMSRKGIPMSEHAKQLQRDCRLGKKRPEHSKALKGRKRPDQAKAMSGEGNPMFGKEHPAKGKKINQPRMICPICGVESTRSAITRYHKHENE